MRPEFVDIATPAPELGQHTREVLCDLGYSQAEMEAFVASGVAEQQSLEAEVQNG